MAIYHIVLFKFKSLVPLDEVKAVSLFAFLFPLAKAQSHLTVEAVGNSAYVISDSKQACNRMLALKTNCKHPETKQEYVKTSIGGINNSPENIANGFTHAFISQFDNEDDRAYYLSEDPAHLGFVKSIGEIVDLVQVIDFTPGVF
ncbi:hypothetical protein PFICI_14564 [Pestalotiopsis fici W106-1]|uniref:Stress-response A/B barrel domain-containing protein n=1 Tax=Pestalotiopsis fici (strain W106-1 / CGMCC3.15140) TaxID=1229662 RepID=W3WIA5_PESFW|nr:uncharacterized protein PFICI_14564 [Pestalotiopsis fici W106-1]ETS73618.1 hypothetical protein PFICI_14564 [Pestalotiopsis fici W106-1]